MIKFNVHYTCKNNNRHTAIVMADDGDDARMKVRQQITNIAYVNKVKVIK